MDHLFWVALLGIVWIDLLLSGDNAVVIALVSRQLPPSQQKWGIIGGTAAAIGLRVGMSFFAGLLLNIPALSLIGGAYLLKVAADLLIGGDEAGAPDAASTLKAAIITIALADASMSLDNVMAIAALSHGNMFLMALGVLLSIPLVIAGSAIISMVIGRFPILTWAGAALLGWVAGGIIAADPLASPYLNHYAASAVGLLIVLAVGWFYSGREEAEAVA
ncbi:MULTISPECIES: TerC family protein [unclassified Bradyrhizobium]|uniref:TerC family protein n=1 Tax=unclassified Bradyrhizobium TaxID=2631580 RepID=UPI0028E96E1E|nr:MULTISPECIES: TerC family protein [unclassified Bradyrhizobium]